jgi:hypothetical protein
MRDELSGAIDDIGDALARELRLGHHVPHVLEIDLRREHAAAGFAGGSDRNVRLRLLAEIDRPDVARCFARGAEPRFRGPVASGIDDVAVESGQGDPLFAARVDPMQSADLGMVAEQSNELELKILGGDGPARVELAHGRAQRFLHAAHEVLDFGRSELRLGLLDFLERRDRFAIREITAHRTADDQQRADDACEVGRVLPEQRVPGEDSHWAIPANTASLIG